MSIKYFSLLASSLIAVVLADNDWSQPCHSGVCSYDIPATTGGPSGTLKIWGSSTSISDITPASGWEIIGCSPDALAQNIRLVCRSHDTSAAGCDHLYKGIGAEGKIIRLPESCGKNAFARVAKAWEPADQSIPPSIAARVVRRDGQAPAVQALTIDTNFGEVDPSTTGIVTFVIQGATIPGAAGNISAPAVGSQRRSRLAERGFGIGSILGGISNLNNFDTSKSTTLPSLDVDKTANLLDKTVSCPPITASLKIDVEAKAHALASIGVAASGTFIPPKISSFGIISSVTADLEGSIDLVADVSGTLDSGLIKLFEVGIPGLDFPGILSIGPNFQINAEATAALDLNVDLNLGINFHISNAQMTFPPSSGKGTSGTFQLDDSPLKLSASPSVTATGSVEAHIIPTLNIGVTALGGSISANIFLDLDASAKMTLSLEAQAQAGVTVQRGIADSPDMNVAHGKRTVDMDDIIVLTPWTTLTIPMPPATTALPTDLPQQSTEPYPGLTSATRPAETDEPVVYSSTSLSNSHGPGVTSSAVSSAHIRYSAASSPTAAASTPILISPIESIGPVRIPPLPLTTSVHGSSVVGYPIPSSPVHETTIRGTSSTPSASVNGHSSAASSGHPSISVATPIGGSYSASPSKTAPILSSSPVLIGSPSAMSSGHTNIPFTTSPTGYNLPITSSGAALPSSSGVKGASNTTASTATYTPSSSGWIRSSVAASGSPSSIKGYPSAVPSAHSSASAAGSAGGYYPAPSASAHSNSSATAPGPSTTRVFPSGIAPTQYPGTSSPAPSAPIHSSSSMSTRIGPFTISISSGASGLPSTGRSSSSVVPSSSAGRSSSSTVPSSSAGRSSSSAAPSSSTHHSNYSAVPSSSAGRSSSSAAPSSPAGLSSHSAAPSSSAGRSSSSVVPSSRTVHIIIPTTYSLPLPITRSSSSAAPSSSVPTSSSVTPSHTSSGISPTPSVSTSFGGCFDISAALNVNAGATGSFLGLFDSNTKITLFSKNFDLFKKCFGSPSSKRSVPFNTISPTTRALGLTCPAPGTGAAVSVADEVAKAV